MTLLRHLCVLLGAAATSTGAGAGAALGTAGMWTVNGHLTWSSSAVWLARNTASVLLIGTVGLRLSYCWHHHSVSAAAEAEPGSRSTRPTTWSAGTATGSWMRPGIERAVEGQVVAARSRLARISSWWSAAQPISEVTISWRLRPSGARVYSTRGGTSA